MDSANYISELLSASDYRTFLKLVVEKGSRKRWGSYTAFSKKSGFSSRSYVRDVVSGKRRLTPKTLGPVASTMALSSDLRTYFKLLVSLEENDIRPRELAPDQVRTKLRKLKERLLKRKAGPRRPAGMVAESFGPEIYAALGTQEGGASLDEICMRTGLAPDAAGAVLAKMCETGAVRGGQDPAAGERTRYFPGDIHVVSQAMDEIHKTYFISAAGEMIVRAKRSFDSPERLYWKSVFSMRPELAPRFKEELRELILRFVDRAEDPAGETLGHITIAFESRLNGGSKTG